MSRFVAEWAAFLHAVQFLTRLPARPHWSEDRMAASPRWYPAVGILVGAIAGAVFWMSNALFSPLLAVLLALGAGVLLTGALHEDGFADCCDGLGGGATRARALEIMRDSRIGAYGVLGLGLVLAMKAAALAGLAPGTVPMALIGGHAASRFSITWMLASASYARDEGAAAGVAGARPRLALPCAIALCAVAPLALQAGFPAALAALAGLALGAILMFRILVRRIGGYTGDGLGGIQQVSETGFYLGLVALAPAG